MTETASTTRSAGERPTFTHGSITRHVLVMTGTGLIGLMSIFVVDFLNLFYIAQLKQPELSAAVGYCGAILFFLVSIAIGITIATGALTARAIGSGNREHARRIASSSLVYMAVVMGVMTAVLWPFLDSAVGLLGAAGRTKTIAADFLRIAIFGMPIMAMGMALSGVLRAVGDAKRAMYVTLIGGLSLAVLDPLLIFGLNLGLTGAAIATVLSRIVLFAVGWWGAVSVHNMVARPDLRMAATDTGIVTSIALPAVLTNVATPVGNAWVTAMVAPYGDSAIAGWTVVDRLVPLAFGGLFAMAGSVGPILAQNLGANKHARVRQTLTSSVVITFLYVMLTWVLLALLRAQIIAVFNLSGDGAAIVNLFCNYTSGSFLFLGALFVANAAFNNLGFAVFSTGFNWGRATLGTIPFAYVGGAYNGVIGIGIGISVGMLIFGTAALITCYWAIARLARRAAAASPAAIA